jgi:predicted phosphoribosyltransferase
MYQRFVNREEAAMELVQHLSEYKGKDGVVLAVPRGGVPIAYHVAKAYHFPLELLMTKKIGHPDHEEFAIGAVSLEDYVIDNIPGISQDYVDEEIKRIRRSLQERYRLFMGDHKPVSIANKVVIIIDDGMATGNTIISSIKMLQRQQPKKIVVAVPVAPLSTLKKLGALVHDVVCLHSPEPFVGVGLHYADFSQVSDLEVIRLLKEIRNFNNAA